MRLSMTTSMIKNGQILFPPTGTEELIQQLTGFGVEKHDDLADAFVMAVLKVSSDDNENGRFTVPKIVASEPKIKNEKQADLARALEDEYERGLFNAMMRR